MIAHCAAERGWFVLSNDSDFAIYDVPGFVIMDTVSLSAHRIGYGLVSRRDLAGQLLGNRTHLLPLWATLCGNDYLDKNELDGWHRSLGRTSSPSDVLILVAKWLTGSSATHKSTDIESLIRQVTSGLCECPDASVLDRQRLKNQQTATSPPDPILSCRVFE